MSKPDIISALAITLIAVVFSIKIVGGILDIEPLDKLSLVIWFEYLTASLLIVWFLMPSIGKEKKSESMET